MFVKIDSVYFSEYLYRSLYPPQNKK